MSCFGGGLPDFEEEKPLIVDVHKILCDRAWNNYTHSFGYFSRKCLKRSNFKIEVPENYLVFEQISQKITNPGRGIITSPSSEEEAKGKSSGSGDRLQGKVPKHRASNPEAISLDTTFCNDTAEKQTYQFKFSKTRTTHVEVSFQKGFTIGGKASFSIGAPKFLGDGKLGLESEKKYSITKSEGQSFEESMNMEVTSDIAVGPSSSYVANVQLEERTIHASYIVRTRMSMPQGEAPIYIRRKSDNSLAFVFYENSLKVAFEKQEKMCKEVKDGDKIATDKIDFVTEGYIKGSLACDHTINLTSDETAEEKALAKTRRF